MAALPVFFFLLFLASGCGAVSYDREYDRCKMVVESWANQALQELAELPKNHNLKLKELLYFLHVPRTGGRTYHQCLLRHLYPMEQHCDRSYDKLRFNSSKHCRLLVTHDDYSVLTRLPAESTSVVTNMRHPVDRIFSAYEFSVEVAARFLVRNSRTKTRVAKATKNNGPSTLNIWPWSLLVPWMREDLFGREKARQLGGLIPSFGGFSHYNASSYVMPLHEFIHQPIVKDILHNGATFQVAGLTNNSYIKGAGEIRECVFGYPDLGLHVLNVAKRRFDKMIFVGLTDKHKDSAKLFAYVVGGQMLPLGQPSNNSLKIDLAVSSSEDPVLSKPEASEQPEHLNNSQISQVASTDPGSWTPPPKDKLTVYGLIEKYKNCANRLRSTQIQRRISSLKNALPVNFSKEARHQVAEGTLEAIRQMNSLDVELYAYAQSLFSKYQVSSDKASSSMVWEPESPYTQLIVDERLHGWYPPWFGSRKLRFLMLLSMGGGIVTIGAGLLVFLNGSRIPRFQKVQVHGVHEKM